MNAAFDFIPKYCPNCGRDFVIDLNDFYAGEGHTCDCGFHFAYAMEAQITKAVDGTQQDFCNEADKK